MKPRIGVSGMSGADEGRPLAQVNRSYINAVVQAGGIPLVVPVLEPDDAARALCGLDGVLLTGGGDVDPSWYGQESVSASGVDPERDATELALAQACVDRGLPLLGICRGAQLLNVALGGTLHQDVAMVTDIPHRVPEADDRGVHEVHVEPGSLLDSIVGLGPLPVNSLHHQAVDRPGAGLRISARASDGTVEAVEGGNGGHVLGVQWHPELLMPVPTQARIFEWHVEMALRVAAGLPAGSAAVVSLQVAVA